MKVNNDKDDWDEHLPHALLVYRASKPSSTGATPFEMLYGRDPRIPLGIDNEEVKSKPTRGPVAYLEDLKNRCRETEENSGKAEKTLRFKTSFEAE